MICAGFDEVGRGSWAGPLLIAGVVIDDSQFIGLKDSKQLSQSQRQDLTLKILQHAHDVSLCWIPARRIDSYGLAAALKFGFQHTASSIQEVDTYLIDGSINYLTESNSEAIIKGDEQVPAIAAASILAKYYRDTFMKQVAIIHKGYGFETHVGYGTKAHKKALSKLGITKYHRTSFKPVRNYA